MSKYIIELGEDAKAIQSISITSLGNVYVDSWYVENLEELNSDYINEHFGDLQDTAYQKGFEDGVTKRTDGDVCAGCEYEGKTGEHLPCEYCKNNFKNQWTAKKEEIGVGDVVETKSGTIFAVTKITTDGFAVGFNGDGNTCCFDITKLTKTGKHYNINEILGWLSDD